MIQYFKIITWLTSQLTIRIAAETTAALIAAGASLAGTGASAGFQGVRGRKNRKAQEKYNEQQQENWQKQFDYTKYINENQYQIQAKDQIAAGINPVAANGGSMNTFSATAGGEAAKSDPVSIDTAGLAQIGLQYAQMKHESEEKRLDRESAEKIAGIQANASNYAADSSAGASISNAELAALTAKEQRLHEENQNRIQRQHEKEIHKLDNKSKEQIADWTMQIQAALQNAQQAWEDSNNHRIAQEAYQRMMKDVQLDYEAENYLAKQQVAFRTASGDIRTMSIQDAIDYMIYDQAMYDGRTDVRALNELRETARTLGDLFSIDRGSIYDRDRMETTRRRSRGYSR